MSEPLDPGPPGPGGEERWAKWEQWRAGELNLRDPDEVLGEPGLGAPGAPTTVPWRAREAVFIFLLHILLTAILAIFPALAIRDRDWLTGVTVVLSQFALLGLTLLWIRMRYGAGLKTLGFRGFNASNLRLGLGLGVAGIGISIVAGVIIQSLIESVTGEPPPQPVQIPLDEDPAGGLLWLVGLMVILLAPVTEEAFFRGFVLGGLRRWAKARPAVIISSFVFALVHLDPTSSEALWVSLLVIVPPIFLLGLVLGAAVERRRSLTPAIVAHLVFNLFGFIALFLV